MLSAASVAFAAALSLLALEQELPAAIRKKLTAEIVDASPFAGRIRVNLNGRSLETAYRSNSLDRLAPGDRITVLLDPRQEAVLLTLGRAPAKT